ncbi:hypothetical protein [Desulforegula conservatrix]|uniref:hypothetical protein n=1 Tax=Desulforegula conservatrix TaxID=153026 RepID=UPI0004011C20|nr:hypothetical protein [Desulforegula conservatrix]
MRINSLYIKEFRNLKYFRIDFVSEGTPAIRVNGKKNYATEPPSWVGGSTL